VLQLGPRQRAELFTETARRIGMDAVIIEKDFWVCWTLQELFRLPQIGEHLIFKGGTSLSKVFKVIQRFSEDIDVSIDRAFLGFGGANEPEKGTSNKDKQWRIELEEAVDSASLEARVLLGSVESSFGEIETMKEGDVLFFKKPELARLNVNGLPAFDVQVGTLGTQVAVQIERAYVPSLQ
jgi:hypothetical protein